MYTKTFYKMPITESFDPISIFNYVIKYYTKHWRVKSV